MRRLVTLLCLVGLAAVSTVSTVGAASTTSAPSIAGVDATTGAARWETKLSRDPGTTATVAYAGNGVVLLTVQGCTSEAVSTMALDARTGRTLWTRRDAVVAFTTGFGYTSALPVVPLQLPNGTLSGTDVRSGKARWTVARRVAKRTPLLQIDTGVHGTVGGVMVATAPGSAGSRKLEAYDLRTGDRRWQVDYDAPAYGFASSDTGELLTVPYVTGPLTLERRSLATGKVESTRQYGDRTFTLASTHVWDDADSVTAGEWIGSGVVQSFDRATGALRWSGDGYLDTVLAAHAIAHLPATQQARATVIASGAAAWTDTAQRVSRSGGDTIVLSQSAGTTAVAVDTGQVRWQRTATPSQFGGTTAGVAVLTGDSCAGDGGTDIG